MKIFHKYWHVLVLGVIVIFFVGIGLLGTVTPYFVKPADRGYIAQQGFIDDYVGYVSYVKEGMYGSTTFKIRSIPPPQSQSSAQLLYVFMGRIGVCFSWDAPFIYLFFCGLFGALLIVSIYWLMNILFSGKKSYALLATLTSCIATSVGVWTVPGKILSYTTFAYFYFSNNDALRFTNRPHYLLGAIIFILISGLYLKKHTKHHKKRFGIIVILSFILGTVHPTFSTILGVVSGIMLLYHLVSERSLKAFFHLYTATILGLSMGLVLSYWSVHQYPYVWMLSFEDYVKNSITPLSIVLHDFVVFGPVFWFGTIGLIVGLIRRKIEIKHFYMVLWLFIQLLFFFFLYRYLRSERVRYIQSLYYIPMAYGLVYLFTHIKIRIRRFVLPIGMTLIVLSVIPTLVTATYISYLANTDYQTRYPYRIFPTINMMHAYEWLDTHTPLESTVLASTEAANHIIMYSHNFVIGNKQGWPAGLGAQMEQEKDLFYKGMDSESALEYLQKNNISYVYGGYEEIGEYIHYPFLKSVYSNPEVTIYQVIR